MGQCWNTSAWVFLRGAFNILQNEGVTLDSTMITGWNWRPPYMVTILSHCAGRWSQVHAGCKDNSHTAPNRQNICLRLLRMASAYLFVLKVCCLWMLWKSSWNENIRSVLFLPRSYRQMYTQRMHRHCAVPYYMGGFEPVSGKSHRGSQFSLYMCRLRIGRSVDLLCW